MRYFHKITAVAALLLLAACSTLYEGPDVRAAINSVSIQEVQIEVEPRVYAGLPALDETSAKKRIGDYTAALTYALKQQVIGKPGGAIPAKLIVRLHRVDLASGVASTARGGGAYVGGTAVIVDLKRPNRVIAMSPASLVAYEDSNSGFGNIGIYVALAFKGTDAATDARAERMARHFAESVEGWLVKPR